MNQEYLDRIFDAISETRSVHRNKITCHPSQFEAHYQNYYGVPFKIVRGGVTMEHQRKVVTYGPLKGATMTWYQ